MTTKNTFEERLKQWNGGILFGAASKFAKKLKISHTNVTAWRKGLRPGEQMIRKIAKEFGIQYDEASTMWASLKAHELATKAAVLLEEIERLKARLDSIEKAQGLPREKKISGSTHKPPRHHDRPPVG